MAYRGDKKTWRNDTPGWGEMQLFSPIPLKGYIFFIHTTPS